MKTPWHTLVEALDADNTMDDDRDDDDSFFRREAERELKRRESRGGQECEECGGKGCWDCDGLGIVVPNDTSAELQRFRRLRQEDR